MPDSKSPPRGAAFPVLALQAAMTGASTSPVRRALWLDALEHQFRPQLPPAVASHCRLANVAEGRLVFVVDSPVWKARLRLSAPELLQLAQANGLAVTELVVKVTSRPLHISAPATPAARPMSETARRALREAVASLQESPGTAAAPPPKARPSRD